MQLFFIPLYVLLLKGASEGSSLIHDLQKLLRGTSSELRSEVRRCLCAPEVRHALQTAAVRPAYGL